MKEEKRFGLVGFLLACAVVFVLVIWPAMQQSERGHEQRDQTLNRWDAL
jgi:hypothetical protein